jgi:hypothetical protein
MDRSIILPLSKFTTLLANQNNAQHAVFMDSIAQGGEKDVFYFNGGPLARATGFHPESADAIA